jgi:hypothetical protein
MSKNRRGGRERSQGKKRKGEKREREERKGEERWCKVAIAAVYTITQVMI